MEGPCDECVFPLLQKFTDVYEPGDTPLMFAAYHGHEHCVEAWVDAGADVNTANSNGDTALIHASQAGYDNCVLMLLRTGADVNHSNIHDDSALLFSASEGHVSCMRTLIDAGADVNASDDLGWTSLSTAASFGHTQCVILLLQEGAFINSPADNKALTVESKETAILLHAAGQTVNPFFCYELGEMLHKNYLSRGLKDLCRRAIRKHLLKLNPRLHLLNRIPRLGLPSLLTKYLLYDVSVDILHGAQ